MRRRRLPTTSGRAIVADLKPARSHFRLTPRPMRNLKLALRTLFRTPFVTVVAVVSLALGIGATAAIFSLFNQMLLRPLPVQAPEQLVNLAAPGPKPGSQSCNQAGECDDVFSYAMFRDLEKAQAVFTGMAAHRIFGANLAHKGQTLSGSGMLVSGSYFPTLGLQPALGRLLAARRRSRRRRSARRRSELRLLADTFRSQPCGPQRLADRQRAEPHHRRRRATRVRGHHAWAPARGVRADHAARADGAGLQGVRESTNVLGVRLRAAQARSLDRSGQGGHQRALQGASSTRSRRRCRRA